MRFHQRAVFGWPRLNPAGVAFLIDEVDGARGLPAICNEER